MLKRFCFLLVVFTTFNLFAVGLRPVGDGTRNNPFQISTLQNLEWMSDLTYEDYQEIVSIINSTIHFVQTADIDASETINWNDGKGFKPISFGFESGPLYYQSFNYLGQNYEIRNLSINRPEEDSVALFKGLFNSRIKNMNLIDFVVSGRSYTGLLAGNFYRTDIDNCNFSGEIHYNDNGNYYGGIAGYGESITLRNNKANIVFFANVPSYHVASCLGGLVGYARESTIFACESSIMVTENHFDYVGGLTGSIYFSVISKSSSNSLLNGKRIIGGISGQAVNTVFSECSSTGTMYGEAFCGGIAAIIVATGEVAKVSNSYSACEINANNSGGLAYEAHSSQNSSYPYAPSEIIIENCYATGFNSFSGFNGGLVAEADSTLSVINSFWNIDVSTQISSAGGIGLTNNQMLNMYSFFNNGWDFAGETENGTEDIWTYDDNSDYNFPVLSWESLPLVDKKDEFNAVPEQNSLKLSNYPNPFNPSTQICFEIPKNQTANLSIYNVKGQLVKRYNNLKHNQKSVTWLGKNNQNQPVASGVYFYKLKTKNKAVTNKMLLMK